MFRRPPCLARAPRTHSVFEVVRRRPTAVVRTWSRDAALVVVGVDEHEETRWTALVGGAMPRRRKLSGTDGAHRRRADRLSDPDPLPEQPRQPGPAPRWAPALLQLRVARPAAGSEPTSPRQKRATSPSTSSLQGDVLLPRDVGDVRCRGFASSLSASRRRARATATSSPISGTGRSLVLRRVWPCAVRCCRASASRTTLASVSSPRSKMLTWMCQSRTWPGRSPAEASGAEGAGAAGGGSG